MMVMTAKVDLKKILAALAAAAAVVLALVVLLGGGDQETAATAAPAAGSNDARVEFLKSFGWEVTTSPTESSQVKIPTDPDPVFQRYNALQKGHALCLQSGQLSRCHRAGVCHRAGIQGGNHRRRHYEHRPRRQNSGLPAHPRYAHALHRRSRANCCFRAPNHSRTVISISILPHLPPLDKSAPACYAVKELNSIFRAGRTSPPAV